MAPSPPRATAFRLAEDPVPEGSGGVTVEVPFPPDGSSVGSGIGSSVALVVALVTGGSTTVSVVETTGAEVDSEAEDGGAVVEEPPIGGTLKVTPASAQRAWAAAMVPSS